MRSEVKERIEKIDQGIVPEGYKKTKVGTIPEDWEVSIFEKIFTEIIDYRGKTPKKVDSGIVLLTAKNIKKGYLDFSESIEYINKKDYKVVMKRGVPKVGDIVLTTEAPMGNVSILDDSNVAIAQRVIKLSTKNLESNKYFKYKLLSYEFQLELLRESTGSTVKGIKGSRLKKLNMSVPPLEEQEKIADILSTWDKAIETIEKLIKEKKTQKKGLMQELLTGERRLAGFSGELYKYSFDSIFIRIPSKKYQVKKSDYLESGLYPIVDQGKNKIAGYSNQKKNLLEVSKDGLIVFGDHTREIKFIDFDIIIGADGTQLIDVNQDCDIKYYYYYLLNSNIPNTGYNRHFKFIKEMVFKKPPLEEQEAIAEILSTADKEIELLNQLLANKKEEKKGLMQLLLTGIVRV